MFRSWEDYLSIYVSMVSWLWLQRWNVQQFSLHDWNYEIKRVVLGIIKELSCWVNEVGSSKVVTQTCLALYLCSCHNQGKAYLKMLPLLLESNVIITSCGGPFLPLKVFLVSACCVSCSWLVSSVVLLLLLLVMSSSFSLSIVFRPFCSSHCFIPTALVDNTYPKEYTCNNKDSLYKRGCLNILA